MKEKSDRARKLPFINVIKRQPKIVTWIILVGGISLLVVVFAAFQLREIREIRGVGKEAYDRLAELVKKKEVITGAVDGQEQESTIDFALLQEINKDAVAWLEGPGGNRLSSDSGYGI